MRWNAVKKFVSTTLLYGIIREPFVAARQRAAPHVHHADTDIVSIKPKHGNARAYTLARLKRDQEERGAAEHPCSLPVLRQSAG